MDISVNELYRLLYDELLDCEDEERKDIHKALNMIDRVVEKIKIKEKKKINEK